MHLLLFAVIYRCVRSGKNFELPTVHTFPTEREQGHILPACLSFHTVYKCPFHSLFNVTFVVFCVFCW